jgi:hypothetical protein
VPQDGVVQRDKELMEKRSKLLDEKAQADTANLTSAKLVRTVGSVDDRERVSQVVG